MTIDSDPVGGRDTSVGSTNTLSLNDPPTAVDDGPFSVEEDGSVILIALPQWLINDSDPDGDPLGVSGFDATTALGGTVTLLGGGAYRYDPPPDYAGDDTFTYTITDGQGNFATATITLVVMDVNDDPSFTAGSDVSLPEDAGAYSTGWAAAISAGPASESGQTVMFSVVGNSNPGLFAVLPAIAADGTLSFTALADTSGIASIDVELSDDGGTANGGDDTSPVALFTITVNPVNDEPSFIPAGDVSVLEGSAAYSGTWATALSAGAADESGQILTFTVVGTSNPGLFAVLPAVTPGGTLTFTPAAATTGSATIDVELSDDGGTGNGGDDTAPVVSFQVDVAQGGLYYLRETGSGADYDLSVVAPPPGPIADYEGDDDPGLTIDKSGGGVNEPDPDKYQNWNLSVPSTMELVGPVVLNLWSATEDFDDSDLAAGRMLQVKLLHGHDPLWVSLADGTPTTLTVCTGMRAPETADDSDATLEDGGPTSINVVANDLDASLDPASMTIFTPRPSGQRLRTGTARWTTTPTPTPTASTHSSTRCVTST